MNRHVSGLGGALIASVVFGFPSSAANTPRITAKQAVLKGIPSAVRLAPEPMVSQLIVKLRTPSKSELVEPMSSSRLQARAFAAGVGMRSARTMAGDATLVALDTPLTLSEANAAAARIAVDPSVEYAEPNIMYKRVLTPNEPRFGDRQWNLFPPSALFTGALTAGGGTKSAPATGGANLQLAWDVTTGVNNVVVAIIDTGIVNHPDLNGVLTGATYTPSGRFLPGYDFISSNVGAGSVPPLPANFVANDGNGRDADASDPGDWVTAAEKTMFSGACDDGQAGQSDSSWHGSHMAGVAAATTNNSLGVAGVAWNVRILPIRALGKCGGDLSDIAEAVRWAAGLSVPGVPANTTPARILNLSLGGGSSCSPTMQSAVDAVIAVGAVVLAATGNDGSTTVISPANCNGVIAVTAHTINGENADYANIGAAATISSPGGGTPSQLGMGGETDDPNWLGFYVWSTILFGPTGPLSTDNQGRSGAAYGGFTGTSAATPHVAGFVALIKSVLPGATPSQIRSFITTNARAFPAGSACAPGGSFVGLCGAGLLDTTIAPNVTAAPQNATVTAGQVAAFGVGAAGLGPLAYQWQRDGSAIAGATGATYTTPALAVTDSNGVYTVAVTNQFGFTLSAGAVVTVNPPSPAAPGGVPPPTGGGGGGGALPFWQLLLVGALSLAARARASGLTG